METEQILEKLKNFLEKKCNLDPKDCYFITKKLNEDYWELVLDDGDQEDIDDFDDLEDDEEIEEPKRIIKSIPMPKKPKVDEEFED